MEAPSSACSSLDGRPSSSRRRGTSEIPMRRPRALATLLGFAALAFVAVVSADGRPPAYRVIVNPANDASSVDREFLADAFLKKATTWPTSETIRPADLAGSSPGPRQFSNHVPPRTVA